MSGDNVIPLFGGPAIVGDGHVVDPDGVLEAFKGNNRQVVVVSMTPDGELRIGSSHGTPDAHFLLGKAMQWLVTRAAHEREIT